MAKISVGNIPPEATQQGQGNASPPPEQRAPEGAKEGTGPKKGEHGEFLPASYKTASGCVRTDR